MKEGLYSGEAAEHLHNCQRQRSKLFFVFSALLLVMSVVMSFSVHLLYDSKHLASHSCVDYVKKVPLFQNQLHKRAAAEDHPTFSTSTYANGRTSTFVYTTRPIVNPGGYTIGTLTGYVVESSAAHSASVSSAIASASSLASSAASAATSSVASSKSKSHHKSHHSSADCESHTKSHTKSKASSKDKSHTQTKTHTATATATSDSASATPTVIDNPKYDEKFELKTDSAGREFSFSIGSDHEVATYVKTTRPIVNPGGYTIGTLDGAYVTYAASSAAASGESVHDELRE